MRRELRRALRRLTDVCGAAGQALLDRVALRPACRARINSSCRVIDCLNVEVEVFTRLTGDRLCRHLGYVAIQASPEVGSILAAGVCGPTAATRSAYRPIPDDQRLPLRAHKQTKNGKNKDRAPRAQKEKPM